MRTLELICQEQNRIPVLLVSGGVIFLIAVADWWTKPFVAFGFLYLFPIMLAAGFLRRWIVILLGVSCAILSELFSSLGPSNVRSAFEALALPGCGLFARELICNRRLALRGQERLKALVETSPAAIVTVDERGLVELANQAAVELMAPRDRALRGSPIAAFLPGLHHALRWEEAPQFRATMQCRGHRGNGEAFTADVWFSTYRDGAAPKVAAIITEVNPENVATNAIPKRPESQERASLNVRELGVLRLLVQGLPNREIAMRMELSESTVKNTLQHLFFKTNVRSRGQLVRVALDQYRDVL